jgi:hypothetical protein
VAEESTAGESNGDPLLKFGAAALGVLAGGVLLSMAGRGRESTRNAQSDQTDVEGEEDQTDTNQYSTVVIEELIEDDDEWVSVPQ